MLPYDAIYAMALKHEHNSYHIQDAAKKSRKSCPRKRTVGERLSEVYNTALSLLV